MLILCRKTAWNLLFQNEYQELRRTICKDKSEVARFRSLLVNTSLATDIADKSLKNRRKARWEKAFNNCETRSDSDSMNRKATAVIEHLMQAADVSHASKLVVAPSQQPHAKWYRDAHNNAILYSATLACVHGMERKTLS